MAQMNWTSKTSNFSRAWLLTVAIAATSVVASRADAGLPPGAQLEEHTIHQNVYEMGWGQDLTTTMDVPLFDTMGGTRELLDLRFSYRFSYDRTISWDANPYDEYTAARVTWGILHRLGPIQDILGFAPNEMFTGGNGAYRPPFDPAFSLSFTNAGVSWGYDIDGNPSFDLAPQVEDPSYIAMFMGSGDASWDNHWQTSELTYSPGNYPEPYIYAPELLHAQLDRVGFELIVYYGYQTVPAPSALALLGLAGVTARRRRRTG